MGKHVIELKWSFFIALVAAIAVASTWTSAEAAGTTFDLQLSELQQGDMIVAPIVLSGVDTGVSHLSMSVRLSHPDVAEIVGADFSGFGSAQVNLVSGLELNVVADDVDDTFGAGFIEHGLGSLTIQGLNPGKVRVWIEIHELIDDNGKKLGKRGKNKMKFNLEVIASDGGAVDPTPGDVQPTLQAAPTLMAVGEIASVPVTLSDIASGVSQFDVTITMSDPFVASLAGMNLPDYGDVAYEVISMSEIRVMVTDVNDLIDATSASYTLLTLNLIGQEPGNTTISLLVNSMTDDAGAPIDPIVIDQVISVQ